jgi:sugar lactone lactonase YvrE
MLAAAGSAAMAAAGSGGHAGTAAGSGGAPQAMPPSAAATVATLYWLDINANRVMRSQNFARGETIVMRTGTAPDGVSVDVAGGKLYWTNMGSPLGTGGGSLQRANLDGTQVETIVAPGISQTPKQMQLDLVNQHLYWCDREGAKVWRAGMDGSQPEVIASEHGFRELVGVALDVPAGKFYFSDRIDKKLLRANIQMPAGQTGATRSDIEEQVVLTGNAMPIDLEIDHSHHYLYWTDRQRGTVERAGLEIPTGATAANRTDIETLVTGLTETIGIAVDVANDKMYFAELGGRISSAALDGSNVERGIVSSGSATGVAIAHIPAP